MDIDGELFAPLTGGCAASPVDGWIGLLILALGFIGFIILDAFFFARGFDALALEDAAGIFGSNMCVGAEHGPATETNKTTEPIR